LNIGFWKYFLAIEKTIYRLKKFHEINVTLISFRKLIHRPLNWSIEPTNAIGEKLILRRAQSDHFLILQQQWNAIKL
jgi:hypothetical protein